MRLHSYLDKRNWRKEQFEYVSMEFHHPHFPLQYNLASKVSGMFVDLNNNPYKIKDKNNKEKHLNRFRGKQSAWWFKKETNEETKRLYRELIK